MVTDGKVQRILREIDQGVNTKPQPHSMVSPRQQIEDVQVFPVNGVSKDVLSLAVQGATIYFLACVAGVTPKKIASVFHLSEQEVVHAVGEVSIALGPRAAEIINAAEEARK